MRWCKSRDQVLGLAQPAGYVERERRMIATHESGHAAVAWLIAPERTLEVLSIVKRRSALGLLAHSDPDGTARSIEHLDAAAAESKYAITDAAEHLERALQVAPRGVEADPVAEAAALPVRPTPEGSAGTNSWLATCSCGVTMRLTWR